MQVGTRFDHYEKNQMYALAMGFNKVKSRKKGIKLGFHLYRICHLLVTGFIVISLSIFLASGAIGENFTDNPYPYPNWLIPIWIWAIGAVLSFIKKTVKIGLVISFLPLLFYIVVGARAYFSL